METNSARKNRPEKFSTRRGGASGSTGCGRTSPNIVRSEFNEFDGEPDLENEEHVNSGNEANDETDKEVVDGSDSDFHVSDGELDQEEEDGWSDYDSDREFTVNEEADDDKIVFRQFDIFNSVDHFRAALATFVIQEGVELYKPLNDKRRVKGVCKGAGCDWTINASVNKDKKTFVIKSVGPDHTCTKIMGKNKAATYKWIANKMKHILLSDPEIKVDAMVTYLRENHGVNVHKMTCYRTKDFVIGEHVTDHKKGYALLPKYNQLLLEKNPGTICTLIPYPRDDLRQPIHFRRMFVCFRACKNGFLRGCRPFIGLDGCHLKGRYGGVLLSAISVDGNYGIYPVAFGVAETESKDSWLWFLENLNEALNIDSWELGLTFMSDKQKGLSQAITDVFPGAYQRNCSRHLYCNFKQTYRGELLKIQFWKAARAPNEYVFKQAMDDLKSINADAHEWLVKNNDPFAWSRHAFNGRAKADHITNNMAESFNNWIGPIRGKPILTLVDELRIKLMQRLNKRYKSTADMKKVLTPNVIKQLDKVGEEARSCAVVDAGDNKFEVTASYFRCVVDLTAKTCDCKVWQATGLPCKHVVAAIKYNRANLHTYCNDFYTVQRYKRAHEEKIIPLPDLQVLVVPTNDVWQPPILKKRSGRPKKARRRLPGEAEAGDFSKRVPKCNICKEVGHNKRCCSRGKTKAQLASSSQPNQRRDITSDVQVHHSSQRSTRSQPDQLREMCSQRMQQRAATIRAKRRAAKDGGGASQGGGGFSQGGEGFNQA